MSQELQEQRPETSKCSRLEKRRIKNQNLKEIEQHFKAEQLKILIQLDTMDLKKKIQNYDKDLFRSMLINLIWEMVLESELIFIYSQILIKLNKKISVTQVQANSQSQFKRLIQLIRKTQHIIALDLFQLDQKQYSIFGLTQQFVEMFSLYCKQMQIKNTQIFDNSNLGEDCQKHYQANTYNILISENQNKTGYMAF